MTERNKKIMDILIRRKNSMSWNEYISNQIKDSDFIATCWDVCRWLEKTTGIKEDFESELICHIALSLDRDK